MKKLKNFTRITEVDDASNQLLKLYNEASAAVKEDLFLKEVFAEMQTLSDQMTEAIKRDKTQSDLADADAARDKIITSLSTMLTGYAAVPIIEIEEAASTLKAIFDKYGVNIKRKSYVNESSLIESLLLDFSKEELRQAIEMLPGLAEAIASLRSAEDAFDNIRLRYDAAVAKEQNAVRATDVKKPLLACINEKLVVYLNAMSVSNAAVYGDFAMLCAKEIDRVNDGVAPRKESKKAE